MTTAICFIDSTPRAGCAIAGEIAGACVSRLSQMVRASAVASAPRRSGRQDRLGFSDPRHVRRHILIMRRGSKLAVILAAARSRRLPLRRAIPLTAARTRAHANLSREYAKYFSAGAAYALQEQSAPAAKRSHLAPGSPAAPVLLPIFARARDYRAILLRSPSHPAEIQATTSFVPLRGSAARQNLIRTRAGRSAHSVGSFAQAPVREEANPDPASDRSDSQSWVSLRSFYRAQRCDSTQQRLIDACGQHLPTIAATA